MRLSREHIAQMIAHACAEAPNEACGILAGNGDTVTAVHCLENTRHSPFEYELPPAGYLLAARLDDADQFLAVFHSHPAGPAYPSETDRRRAFWPVRYVIVALAGHQPSVRAFRMSRRTPLDMDDLADVVEEQMEVV